MKSLYLEDFEVGQKFITAGRTVTESDIGWFAGLSGDITSLSINTEAARMSEFGGRIAQGMLGSSILFGLWVRLGLMDLNGIAVLETNWRYVLPIRPGDTIHAECEITKVKPSSKGIPKGTVFVKLTGVNQLEEVVQEANMVYLIKARGMY
ncbi:MAG TPA: MaoC/PaaZ C-terminal domain-containing protein [Syntrophomonadaceae bacterium]|nr:MaoC/PaaZ C-terminal domain-containing protein [Syntrophomonadaceae bacterium]